MVEERWMEIYFSNHRFVVEILLILQDIFGVLVVDLVEGELRVVDDAPVIVFVLVLFLVALVRSRQSTLHLLLHALHHLIAHQQQQQFQVGQTTVEPLVGSMLVVQRAERIPKRVNDLLFEMGQGMEEIVAQTKVFPALQRLLSVFAELLERGWRENEVDLRESRLDTFLRQFQAVRPIGHGDGQQRVTLLLGVDSVEERVENGVQLLVGEILEVIENEDEVALLLVLGETLQEHLQIVTGEVIRAFLLQLVLRGDLLNGGRLHRMDQTMKTKDHHSIVSGKFQEDLF